MGYYAHSIQCGQLEFFNKEAEENAIHALQKYQDKEYETYKWANKPKPFTDIAEGLGEFGWSYDEGSIWFEDDKWSSSSEEALYAIAPYVKSGEIRMMGEDDSIWRYVFADGVIEEDNGWVQFGNSEAQSEAPKAEDLSPDELVNAFRLHVKNQLEKAYRLHISKEGFNAYIQQEVDVIFKNFLEGGNNNA